MPPPIPSDPYAGLSAGPPVDQTPIHVPSGVSNEPPMTGTAIVGDQTMPFPVQQDTLAQQAGWIARFNEFDRIKRQAEEDRAWQEMYKQNLQVQQSVRAVESARRFQAVRQYQRRYNELAAVDPSTASARAAAEYPEAFGASVGGFIRATAPAFTPTTMNMPGIGTVVRSGAHGEHVQFPPEASLPGTTPKEITTEGGTRLVQRGRNNWQVLPKDEPTKVQDQHFLQAELVRLDKMRPTPEVKAKIAGYEKELETLRKEIKSPTIGAPAIPKVSVPAIRITSKSQRDALAPGTRYIGPDGKTYVKQ